jgi:hypothetical protein
MRRVALIFVLSAGIAVGILLTSIGMLAMFVTSLSSWLALVIGPFLTIAGCVVGILRPAVGGAVVLVGGLSGTLTFLLHEEGINEHVLPYLLIFTLPICIVGSALILVARWRAIEPADHAT